MHVLELNDPGEVSNFLGMQVDPDGLGYALNQESFVAEMLTRFGHKDANPVRSPIGGRSQL